MTIFENINRLVNYALNTGLIEKADIVFTQNRLLETLGLDGFSQPGENQIDKNPADVTDLENILAQMLEYAVEQKIIPGDSIAAKDLFDTKLMGCLVPPPSVVQKKFFDLYKESPKKATDWYYDFSQNTDYIRRYRVCKDLKWKTATEFGDLDITINLSKPEKDPKAIAAARNTKSSSYPACLLCVENEGYAGRLNHAARQNHRIIPLQLAGENWCLQYSPYVYYNEHCIVFDSIHEPMKINEKTFERLLSFVQQFPHYTLGSNADIPIVGGSILTHNHFQGGSYCFPMEKAEVETPVTLKKFPEIKAGIVNWPMSVIRLNSSDCKELVKAASYILDAWKSYSDEAAFIFVETDGEQHNTITPIARKRGDLYELDLVLRNNITTEEHPLGVYHPHANLHHIKKENIGLIEVMGLAVLPSRLKQELSDLTSAIINGDEISKNETLSKHSDWLEKIKATNPELKKGGNAEKINEILKKEVGIVFSHVLEDAGVFKRTTEGKSFFMKFINIL